MSFAIPPETINRRAILQQFDSTLIGRCCCSFSQSLVRPPSRAQLRPRRSCECRFRWALVAVSLSLFGSDLMCGSIVISVAASVSICVCCRRCAVAFANLPSSFLRLFHFFGSENGSNFEIKFWCLFVIGASPRTVSLILHLAKRNSKFMLNVFKCHKNNDML